MRLEQLKYLLAISQANSLSLASEQLFISQQALSKAMRNLEDELDTKLLIRTNHGVTLTPDGEYALRTAEQVLQLTQDLRHHFALAKTSRINGQLKLMVIPAIRDQFLSKCISNFYKYYPHIHLQIMPGDQKEIISSLLEQQIDLGFFCMINIDGLAYTQIPTCLTFVPFSKYRFVAMLNAQSPLAKLSTVSIRQLLEFPAILMPTTALREFNPYKILQHYGPVKLRTVDSYTLLMQLLEDNLGFSIGPDMTGLSASTSSSIVVRPISDQIWGSMGYIYHNGQPDNPCVDYFLKEFFNE